MSKIEKVGLKDNNNKILLELIDPKFILGIGGVLTYGANKYKPNSWQNVENGIEIHYGAALRHLIKWKCGEDIDNESGLHHLLHAATNIMFVLYHLEDNEVIK